MSTKTMQCIPTSRLLSDGFANTLFNLVTEKLPENAVVSDIIVARNSSGREMRVHFTPLTATDLACECTWWDSADVQADIYSVHADEIAAAAKRRWPEARSTKCQAACAATDSSTSTSASAERLGV